MDQTLYCGKGVSNEKYIVPKLNSNKTQILHRIRLRKYKPHAVLQDIGPEDNLQPDEETVIPQYGIYVITWETNYGEIPISGQDNTIPNRLDDTESLTTLADDGSPQDEISTDGDLWSTEPHEDKSHGLTKKTLGKFVWWY